MSLSKRKGKELAPLEPKPQRQSLQKPSQLRPKKSIEIMGAFEKKEYRVQPNKLRLMPLNSSMRSFKPKKSVGQPQKIEQTSKSGTAEQPKQMRETFMTESSLFTSYYNTETSGWIKPSDYLHEIQGLGLFGLLQDSELQLGSGSKGNLVDMDKLHELVAKWVMMLKKAIFYISSQRTNSDKLSEEIRFWKELSRKFDSLEYEFNDQKIKHLQGLIDLFVKAKPEYADLFTEFLRLKTEVCALTIPIKKLNLCLQETIAPLISQFEQCQDIVTSIDLLRDTLISLHNIFDEFKIIQGRKAIIYRKLNLNLIRCLVASNINPSNVTEKLSIMDPTLSFLSNFISIMEEPIFQESEIMEKAVYEQQTAVTLLQMNILFQHAGKTKEQGDGLIQSLVKEIKGKKYDYNIFDQDNNDCWFQTTSLFEEAKAHSKLFD